MNIFKSKHIYILSVFLFANACEKHTYEEVKPVFEHHGEEHANSSDSDGHSKSHSSEHSPKAQEGEKKSGKYRLH